MKKNKLKPVVLALGLSVFSQMATAVLISDKAVVKNDGSEQVSVKVSFPTPVSGDLYVATQVNGQFFFLTNNGSEFTTNIVPLTSNMEYVGEHVLFDFSGAGIAPGRYPIYQVVTQPGTDPLDFTNWVGGLAGLNSFNFLIGLSPEITKDFDGDGFADDDLNRDGFHDDDLDRDGYHDDDLNRDGFHDDDLNRDGLHDNDDNGLTPTPSTAEGKALYVSLGCAASSCHGATPLSGKNDIDRAINPAVTRNAIVNNKGGMGVLSRAGITDAELQAIADYVKNPQ